MLAGASTRYRQVHAAETTAAAGTEGLGMCQRVWEGDRGLGGAAMQRWYVAVLDEEWMRRLIWCVYTALV